MRDRRLAGAVLGALMLALLVVPWQTPVPGRRATSRVW